MAKQDPTSNIKTNLRGCASWLRAITNCTIFADDIQPKKLTDRKSDCENTTSAALHKVPLWGKEPVRVDTAEWRTARFRMLRDMVIRVGGARWRWQASRSRSLNLMKLGTASTKGRMEARKLYCRSKKPCE